MRRCDVNQITCPGHDRDDDVDVRTAPRVCILAGASASNPHLQR